MKTDDAKRRAYVVKTIIKTRHSRKEKGKNDEASSSEKEGIILHVDQEILDRLLYKSRC